MRLIKLTSIEKRDIAIVADEVASIERGNYTDKYELKGKPTRIILKHNDIYSVREDFETVCALVEGIKNE